MMKKKKTKNLPVQLDIQTDLENWKRIKEKKLKIRNRNETKWQNDKKKETKNLLIQSNVQTDLENWKKIKEKKLKIKNKNKTK